MPAQPLREDPPYVRRGHRIHLQAVQPATPGGVRGVRVQAGVDEPVTVRRPPTKMPALILSLRPHRGNLERRISRRDW
ncbi:hypothetical protein [Micromonospora sp. CPCC 206061]|uniref:hypothetical protein n=1 Tax=Micromonospora sp. CPCC 206061 TaxID=3122410 RepID=UPI002FF21110